MRQSILIGQVDGKWSPIMNTAGKFEHNHLLATDRKANGDAYPGEQAIRLPRSVQCNSPAHLLRCKPYPHHIN